MWLLSLTADLQNKEEGETEDAFDKTSAAENEVRQQHISLL